MEGRYKGKYIEVNELTRPYLESQRDLEPEDLEILRGLIHDHKWWSSFHSASREKKLKMIGILKEGNISK